MNDGNIRRWKQGKRHNAHLKVWLYALTVISVDRTL